LADGTFGQAALWGGQVMFQLTSGLLTPLMSGLPAPAVMVTLPVGGGHWARRSARINMSSNQTHLWRFESGALQAQ
jgi:hypothetical protein